MTEPGTKTPLGDLLDDIVAEARSGPLTLGGVLDDLGDRSYGPLFFIIGVIIMLPIGAVPGVPIILGAVLIILAVQFVIGLTHPWMPARLRALSLTEQKAREVRRRIGGVLAFFDRFIDERARWAVSRGMRVFFAVAIILLSLTMIPLEFIPFGVAAPGAAIAAFGLAIVARDGVLAMIALALTGLAFWLMFAFIDMITDAFSGNEQAGLLFLFA